MKNKGKTMRLMFKKLIHNRTKIHKMPVAGDGLSAKICEKAGFKAINVTGSATNFVYGKPDMGFADFYTLFDQASKIIENVSIPVLCDVGTGHGAKENIARTTRSYEAINATGIYLDDGVWPKRCGQMAVTQIAPVSEMVERIHAAIEARKDPDFVIMAHSSARGVCDIKETIAKLRSYCAAGADMLYIDNVSSEKELQQIAKELSKVPLLVKSDNLAKTLSWNDLFKMGYSMATFKEEAIYARARGEQEVLKQEKSNTTAVSPEKEIISVQAFKKLVDTEQMDKLEKELTL